MPFGEGNGTSLQYSCLETPMDGGAWWTAVYGVTQSQTWLTWLSSSSFALPSLSSSGCLPWEPRLYPVNKSSNNTSVPHVSVPPPAKLRSVPISTIRHMAEISDDCSLQPLRLPSWKQWCRDKLSLKALSSSHFKKRVAFFFLDCALQLVGFWFPD